MSDAAPAEPAVLAGPAAGRRRVSRGRLLLLVLGLALVVSGVLVVAVPLLQVWQRGQADRRALDDWNQGGSQAIVGAVGDSHDQLSSCGAGQAAAGEYALVTFPSLGHYGYAGVAGNGTWDMLRDRSMVHHQDSPPPGAQGNVVIAFHREPNFEHIDELKVGDAVDVQDRACHVFHYRVTERAQEAPDRVTQLAGTSGHDLTLITCTPWYVDTERLVWRASLVGS